MVRAFSRSTLAALALLRAPRPPWAPAQLLVTMPDQIHASARDWRSWVNVEAWVASFSKAAVRCSAGNSYWMCAQLC
ncbi:hypothetical protein D3C85_1699890 [compost metagenome]